MPGSVPVEPDLSIAGHPEILVIGDLAAFLQDGKQLPGVAPTAIQQGRYAAKLIRDRLRNEKTKPFRYFDKGSLATIGRNAAVAQIGPLQFSGILAWLAWLFIHLLYIVEFENRLLIAVHWAVRLFHVQSRRTVDHGLGRPHGLKFLACGWASGPSKGIKTRCVGLVESIVWTATATERCRVIVKMLYRRESAIAWK